MFLNRWMRGWKTRQKSYNSIWMTLNTRHIKHNNNKWDHANQKDRERWNNERERDRERTIDCGERHNKTELSERKIDAWPLSTIYRFFVLFDFVFVIWRLTHFSKQQQQPRQHQQHQHQLHTLYFWHPSSVHERYCEFDQFAIPSQHKYGIITHIAAIILYKWRCRLDIALSPDIRRSDRLYIQCTNTNTQSHVRTHAKIQFTVSNCVSSRRYLPEYSFSSVSTCFSVCLFGWDGCVSRALLKRVPKPEKLRHRIVYSIVCEGDKRIWTHSTLNIQNNQSEGKNVRLRVRDSES